ncbi:MFS transporter [Pseudonocardia sp. EC080619-01]|uniref:MFS transporter n=2 Tax=unclassified Pseudonocardia TaxID=2619320 RepID=UPI001D05B7D6|nr:MFS transporter [Pseudonocardia sp. EC080619-01]
MQTIVVPLLPLFPSIMGVAPSTAAWLVTATLLAGAVAAPVLGRLGDMFGKRRLLVVSLGLVVVGSVIGALAPNIGVLIAARAVQGASLAVIALGMSLMRDVLPPERVGHGVALTSSSLGVGGALGPPVSGLVVEWASWRWLFAAGAVVAVVQLLLVAAVVPESPLRSGGRFDLIGAGGLTLALTSLLLGISKGHEWGWGSPLVIGLLGGAVVALLLWGRYELSRPSPLVDLTVSARRAVLLTNVYTVLAGFAMFVPFMLATQILQAPPATGFGFALSPALAGVLLIPVGAAMMIFPTVSAVLSRRRGARVTLVVGTSLIALGALGIATRPGSVGLLVAVAAVGATGAALAYSALPLLIMQAAPEGETATANSVNTLMRQIGTSLCTAVVASVGSAMTVHIGGDVLSGAGAVSTIFVIAAASAALAAILAGCG